MPAGSTDSLGCLGGVLRAAEQQTGVGLGVIIRRQFLNEANGVGVPPELICFEVGVRQSGRKLAVNWRVVILEGRQIYSLISVVTLRLRLGIGSHPPRSHPRIGERCHER